MKTLMLLIALPVLASCHAHDLVTVHATVTTQEYIAFQYTAEVGVPHPPKRLTAAAQRHCKSLMKRADTEATDIADYGKSQAPFWTVKIPCVTG